MSGGHSKIEQIKKSSRGLRGTIAEELRNDSSFFGKEAIQILKFHGIYQQDDRDLRRARRSDGAGKAYQFMVRIKNPGGGRLTSRQWEVIDKIADFHGNESLRITTRQGIQFHGVGKDSLQDTIRLLQSELVTTYGACGDGNRNTMACPVSAIRKGSVFDGQYWAAKIADRLSFKSTAYYDIWVNGEKVEDPARIPDPIYGEAYLPRKFKIAVASPEDNCVDALTNDIGIFPHIKKGELKGFHLFVGGGLGFTHRKEETFPRLATPLCHVFPEDLLNVVVAIAETQRDLGNRSDRRQARMKYLLEHLGPNQFKTEVEKRYGSSLLSPLPLEIGHTECHRGWHEHKEPGYLYTGLFVENGRIQDVGNSRIKTGLREIIREFKADVLLTPNQDLVLTGIRGEDAPSVEAAFMEYGITMEQGSSPLRKASIACPALPSCGLALAEAERRLPDLISELESAGYGNESIQIRMSGCPNSCSRPPTAEIGIVGKSVNLYNVYAGGNQKGTRLAELFLEDVAAGDLANRLGRLIDLYRDQRRHGESFGDLYARIGAGYLSRSLALDNVSPAETQSMAKQ